MSEVGRCDIKKSIPPPAYSPAIPQTLRYYAQPRGYDAIDIVLCGDRTPREQWTWRLRWRSKSRVPPTCDGSALSNPKRVSAPVDVVATILGGRFHLESTIPRESIPGRYAPRVALRKITHDRVDKNKRTRNDIQR